MLSTKLRRAQRALDKQLRSPTPTAPRGGWIEAVRAAIGMTGQQLANRLGVTWQSMADLQASEDAGTITLNSLRKAAAAMDCKLVYAFVPNTGSFEALVDQRAKHAAAAALARSGQTMLLEDQSASADEAEHRISDYIRDHVRDRDLWTAP